MQDIRELETMTKIALTEDEREELTSRLMELEKGFEEITELVTEGVEPMVTVLEIRNVFRADETQKQVSREELMTNAPEEYEGYFQVPGTLE